MKTAASLATVARVLFVTSDSPSTAADNCLATNYYGTYGGQSVFIPDLGCLEATQSLFNSGSIVDGLVKQDASIDLVWVQEKEMEPSVKGAEFVSFGGDLDALFQALSEIQGDNELADQRVLSSAQPGVELLYRNDYSALLSVPHSAVQILDAHMPRFWSPYVLPAGPLPLYASPTSQGAVDRVKEVLATLEFNPDIASVVHDLSIAEMSHTIRWLTGESDESPIVSRHSFSEDTLVAAAWIKDNIESTGATCDLVPFREGFAPNVICKYPATTNSTDIVLLSAHYDSRGSFGSVRAPGGDDDGSGTTAILHIAKTIGRKGLTFPTNVELVLFAGEEQGLYGSEAYSAKLRAENANLTLMIQSDMLAYRSPDEPPQLGLPATIGTPEVTQLVANVSALYSPELTVGYSSACCSDHQYFYMRGFPATQAFERAGPIVDPMYHNSHDLSEREGYDLHQLRSIAKVTFATLLHTAGFDLPTTA